jgi:uncharacterized protein YutE (UPF0331/DUF86 family)
LTPTSGISRSSASATGPPSSRTSSPAARPRYYLQAAIECSADIGAHIVATDTSRRAEDYRSIFRVLGEESLIPADVAAAMEPTAALRNRLVHAYDQVDDARVHEMLGTAPPILRAFAQAIARHVERAAAAGTPER